MTKFFWIIIVITTALGCTALKNYNSQNFNFSTPRSLVETFIEASINMNKNKNILSLCFSERSRKEWDSIRNKTTSNSALKKASEFVSSAIISITEMLNESHAIVFVTFKTRNEKINTIQKNGRWFILDF